MNTNKGEKKQGKEKMGTNYNFIKALRTEDSNSLIAKTLTFQ